MSILDGEFDSESLITGFGIGTEVGTEDAEDKAKTEKESEGTFEINPDEGFEVKEDEGKEKKRKSLKARHKQKKPGTFEQWVDDVIAGRKTLDDEL